MTDEELEAAIVEALKIIEADKGLPEIVILEE